MARDDATPKIEEITDIEAIVVSPAGLGEAVGTPGPWPFKLRMPIKGKDEEEWPAATFWISRLWDTELSSNMKADGISTKIVEQDEEELHKQHVWLAAHCLDAKKAWENLFRMDGTEFLYRPPGDDEVGTASDYRIILATAAPLLFSTLKGRLASMTWTFSKRLRKNSESSSSTDSEQKPKPPQSPDEPEPPESLEEQAS